MNDSLLKVVSVDTPDKNKTKLKNNELLTLIHSHRNASMDLKDDPSRFWAELFNMYIIKPPPQIATEDEGDENSTQDDILWYVKKCKEGEELIGIEDDDVENFVTDVSDKFFVVRRTEPNLPTLAEPINWEWVFNLKLFKFIFILFSCKIREKELMGKTKFPFFVSMEFFSDFFFQFFSKFDRIIFISAGTKLFFKKGKQFI